MKALDLLNQDVEVSECSLERKCSLCEKTIWSGTPKVRAILRYQDYYLCHKCGEELIKARIAQLEASIAGIRLLRVKSEDKIIAGESAEKL